ncbi:MAG: hypothetical protein K9L86_00235 [Candidatus Omnitrophica bacterium]|nr:hypothetical protein [Candidatus Omnitrophota bacterium]
MDKRKKSFFIFFFSVFFLLNFLIFIKPVQARGFRGFFSRGQRSRSYQSRTYQPTQTKTSAKSPNSVDSSKARQPVVSQGLKPSSGASKGLTVDEQKARQSRQERYHQASPEWNGKRESIDPDKVAKMVSVESKNLSKEGRDASVATHREDASRYKRKQGVTAIDAIDPNNGSQIKIRRSKENGLNVYDVYTVDKDGKLSLPLHKLEDKDKGIIALSAKGIQIKVGYGDSNNPQWAANGYYPTNLEELNIFAGFNRGDDHLIRMISSTSKSPSDLGQRVFEPLRYTVKELATFAQGKDPNSGALLRSELAVLMNSGTLSQAAKVKVAEVMLEKNVFGRVISTSGQLEKISKIEGLGNEVKRDYAVYGARNYQGRGIYFSVEIDSQPFKPDQSSLKKLAEPLAGQIKPLASLERLVEKPALAKLPDWVDKHIEKKNFAWFPKETWEKVVADYGDIKVEKIRSYSDPSRNSIFHEVKIIQPSGGSGDMMLFRLDLDPGKLNR